MTMFENVWLCMTMYDNVWLCVTMLWLWERERKRERETQFDVINFPTMFPQSNEEDANKKNDETCVKADENDLII